MLTEEQLSAARNSALLALTRAGVPREQVVLGFLAGDEADINGDWCYEFYVGQTHLADVAMMLEVVARDIAAEAHRASQGVFRGLPCPNCRSPRFALCRELDDTGPRYRVHMFDECMDCGHTVPR